MRSVLLISVLGISLTACSDNDADTGDTLNVPEETGDGGTDVESDPLNLIEVATEAGSFSTLLAAIEAAGLTETLAEGGPYTVIAPTDEAFAALPEGTVEALLADIPALTEILLYHVVDGQADAAAVAGMSLVPTLQGSDFKVTLDGGSVYLNTAQVVTADVEASNGVIHIVDQVLIPPASVADIAASDPQFSTLTAALGAAGLTETLQGDGTFTVFAPTDAAFAALPAGTVEALLGDIPALTNILLYHVAGMKLTAADVVATSEVEMLQGTSAAISTQTGVTIDGANISFTDIPAANGVIHIIDSVMIPE